MRLTEGFQLLATAPDGVARLRELILSLAVQGKLMPQDPSDEPAQSLLHRIESDRRRLIAEGGISRDKTLPEIGDHERPCQIPKTWEWVRLGSVSKRVQYGFTASARHDIRSPKFVRITDIQYGRVAWDTVPGVVADEQAVASHRLEDGDILIARTGGTIGKSFLVNDVPVDAVFASYLIRISPMRINPRYIKAFLSSRIYWDQLYAKAMGTGQPNVNGTALSRLVLPCPPLAEQLRIAEKIDELMHLCNELEDRGQLEAEQHARLTSTLFDALAASESSHALAENWARVSAHFDLLLDRPEAVDVLEQTVSQLAIRGLLVPQESNDEPASELLQQIRTEKERLIAEGKVKRDKPLPAITEDDKPFELPEQWEWVRTQDICAVITDGDHQAPPKAAEGVPFLVIGDVRWGSLDVASASRFVPDSYFEQLDWSKKPIAGDILYTTVGSFGIPVVVTEEMRFCFQRHIGLFRPAHITLQPFLNLVLASALVLQQASARATGIAQKTVPLSALRDFKIPLPPIAEQHRIVARVVDLRRLCADLREHLTERRTCQARFAEAIVGQTASAATLEDSDALAAA